MDAANSWGRATYSDGSLVSFSELESARHRAWQRCSRARDVEVRRLANRIVRWSSSYRFARWVLAAPAAELAAFARHPAVGGVSC